MLIVLLLPVQSFAAGDDNGLEKAIKIAKEKFDIPEDYKFTYSVSAEGGKKIWYMNWNSKDEIKGSINVRVDDNGTILGYDNYKPYDYNRQKKFPKVSKQEAKAIAEEFIKKINPEILKNVRYQDNDYNNLADYGHYINFVRIVNDIPFYNNSVNVTVNSETGEVTNYYYNWSDNIVFPSPGKVIPVEQAQSAYKEKLGLRLIYSYVLENENMRVYAMYTPKYNNYSYGIDALTGEKIQLEGGYYGPYYDGNMAAKSKMEMAKSSGMGGREPSLTPEELEAVSEASKLITIEQAEKVARDFKTLEMTDDLKLTYSSLSRGWPDKDDFYWRLSFNNEPTPKDKEYRYVSVSIDAKTSEISNFYKSTPYKEGESAKYDLEASKAQVEAFLKDFKADRFSQTEYDDSFKNDYIIYAEQEAPRSYSFRYVRMVNGVAFTANGFTVGFDAVNGKITNFSMNWYDVRFPAIDKVLPVDSIYETLFKDIGMELQYKVQSSQMYPVSVRTDGTQQKIDALLVYVLKQGKPYNFDANTGVVLDYDGKPYKEIKPVEYTDIKGHFAEKQIIALAEYGIALEGTEFKPGESITQKDFFTLLSKIINNYYGPVIKAESTQEDIDNLYNFLMREGIIKEGEKSPDSALTREEGVKFIIRALKYDKVADIKGIYKLSFKDADKINPDLFGYVAIAGGLKIINGSSGYFRPKDQLTRAEAAVMIYNYLQG